MKPLHWFAGGLGVILGIGHIGMIGMIANHMKKSYLLFNKNSVEDKTILIHLDKLSSGKLSVPEGFEFINASSLVKTKKTHSHHYRKKYRKRRRVPFT